MTSFLPPRGMEALLMTAVLGFLQPKPATHKQEVDALAITTHLIRLFKGHVRPPQPASRCLQFHPEWLTGLLVIPWCLIRTRTAASQGSYPAVLWCGPATGGVSTCHRRGDALQHCLSEAQAMLGAVGVVWYLSAGAMLRVYMGLSRRTI